MTIIYSHHTESVPHCPFCFERAVLLELEDGRMAYACQNAYYDGGDVYCSEQPHTNWHEYLFDAVQEWVEIERSHILARIRELEMQLGDYYTRLVVLPDPWRSMTFTEEE